MIVEKVPEKLLHTVIDFEQREAKAPAPAFGTGQEITTPEGKQRVDHRVYVESVKDWMYFFWVSVQLPVGESNETMESRQQRRWSQTELLPLQVAPAPVSPIGEKRRRPARLTGQARLEQAFERARRMLGLPEDIV